MRRWTKLLAPVAVVAPILITALPAQAASTVVAHWQMDSAPMTDSSGNGNDGALTDVSVVPGGVTGNAYSFAGADSHVTVPDSPTLDPGTSDFSFTVHLKFSAVPSKTVGDYDIIRKGLAGTTGGEWKMEILPNANTGAANPFCLFKDDAKHSDTIRGSQDLADDAWHEITCVKTGTTNQLIVDGATKTSSPSAPLGSISNDAPVVVGQKLGGGDQYTGLMDEVSITFGSTPPPANSDTTPPTVTAKTPAAGSTGVSTTTDVTATFSEPVQNITGNTVKLRKSGTSTLIPATVTYDGTTNTATLHPDAALATNTKYTATLTAGIKDLAGNALKATYWNFSTGTSGSTTGSGPTLTAGSPADGATGVARWTNVVATFSEPVKNVGGSTFTLAPTAGGAAIAGAYSANSSGTRWVLNPGAGLAAKTSYTVTLVGGAGGITDASGNPLTTTSWAFTTG